MTFESCRLRVSWKMSYNMIIFLSLAQLFNLVMFLVFWVGVGETVWDLRFDFIIKSKLRCGRFASFSAFWILSHKTSTVIKYWYSLNAGILLEIPAIKDHSRVWCPSGFSLMCAWYAEFSDQMQPDIGIVVS